MEAGQLYGFVQNANCMLIQLTKYDYYSFVGFNRAQMPTGINYFFLVVLCDSNEESQQAERHPISKTQAVCGLKGVSTVHGHLQRAKQNC